MYLASFFALFHSSNAFYISNSQVSNLSTALPTDLSTVFPIDLSPILPYVNDSNQIYHDHNRIKREADQEDCDQKHDKSKRLEGYYDLLSGVLSGKWARSCPIIAHIKFVIAHIKATSRLDSCEKNKVCDFALFQATVHDNLDAVKLVIDNCGNINAKDHNGNTALMLAVEAEDVVKNREVIKWLINNGADVNTENTRGLTVLLRAAQFWRPGIVKWLKDKGANINSIDHNGNTALMYAICAVTDDGRRKNVARLITVIKFLVKNGADVNAVNNRGRTVLWYATHICVWTDERVVEWLRYLPTMPDNMLQTVVVPREEEVKLLRDEDAVGIPQASLTNITTTPTTVFSKLNDRS